MVYFNCVLLFLLLDVAKYIVDSLRIRLLRLNVELLFRGGLFTNTFSMRIWYIERYRI